MWSDVGLLLLFCYPLLLFLKKFLNSQQLNIGSKLYSLPKSMTCDILMLDATACGDRSYYSRYHTALHQTLEHLTQSQIFGVFLCHCYWFLASICLHLVVRIDAIEYLGLRTFWLSCIFFVPLPPPIARFLDSNASICCYYCHLEEEKRFSC